MDRDKIVAIYSKRLDKYWTCSYGAFLDNWSYYGWSIIKIQIVLQKDKTDRPYELHLLFRAIKAE